MNLKHKHDQRALSAFSFSFYVNSVLNKRTLGHFELNPMTWPKMNAGSCSVCNFCSVFSIEMCIFFSLCHTFPRESHVIAFLLRKVEFLMFFVPFSQWTPNKYPLLLQHVLHYYCIYRCRSLLFAECGRRRVCACTAARSSTMPWRHRFKNVTLVVPGLTSVFSCSYFPKDFELRSCWL